MAFRPPRPNEYPFPVESVGRELPLWQMGSGIPTFNKTPYNIQLALALMALGKLQPPQRRSGR